MGPAGIVCCVQGDYLLIGTVLTTEMNEKKRKMPLYKSHYVDATQKTALLCN
jgi:hypothetical protein